MPRFAIKMHCSNLFFVESFVGSESVLSDTTEQFAYVRRDYHSENEVKVRCFERAIKPIDIGVVFYCKIRFYEGKQRICKNVENQQMVCHYVHGILSDFL